MKTPMVSYEEFAKKYGKVVAVAELDLAVDEGETLALIGPNGSGKTTVLKAAVGLLRPTSGRVLVRGLDPTTDGTRVRQLIGYLPQRLAFADRVSAAEVVRLYGALPGLGASDAYGALERVGLADAADRRVAEFSGGMTQRLALAVALMGNPRLVLVDEPTAALDPTGALAIRDVLRDLRRDGCTILFSSHDLAEVAALADRIAIFSDGRLRAIGSLDDLARSRASRLEASVGAGVAARRATDRNAAPVLEDVYRSVTRGPELLS